MLRAALRYSQEFNFAVFPLRPGTKEPLTRHGFLDATRNEYLIRAWWQQHPDANVAIATGAASGVVALDVDPRHAGDEALDALIAKHGRPDTAEQITGGGGKHLLFLHPGIQVPCRNFQNGLEVKGDGGYIVVAPSIHPNGNRYSWDGGHFVRDLHQLAPIPPWLVELAEMDGETTRRTTKIDPGTPVIEGGRNSFLASKAGYLRRAGWGEAELWAALNPINQMRCQPPLPDAEVHAIVHSIARYAPAPEAAVNGAPVAPVAPVNGAPAKEPAEPAVKLPSKPPAAAGPGAALAWISEALQIVVVGIEKRMGDEPSYVLHLAGGLEVEFASTRVLLNQLAVRAAVAAVTNQVIPRFTAARFEALVGYILAHAGAVAATPEDQSKGQLEMLIDDYLTSTALILPIENVSLFEQNGPCLWEGHVAITTAGLRSFLYSHAPFLMRANQDLSALLVALGARRERTCGWYLRKWRWLLPKDRFGIERYDHSQSTHTVH